MYKIQPIKTKEEQASLCAKCQVKFDADLLAYSAKTESGELIGICQFIIDGDCGYIHDLTSAPGVDDFEAMYIMGRATLNFIDLCGVHKAYYLGCDCDLIRKVGFGKTDDGKMFIDLAGFFEHHCGG